MAAPKSRLLILALVAAAIVPAVVLAASPKDPQKRHTKADTRLATSIGLKKADFVAGWKKIADSNSGGSDTCSAQPDESSFVETADVDPTFESANGAVDVDSEVQLFAKASQAASDWRSSTIAALRSCAEEQFKKQFGKTAKTTITATSAPHYAGLATKAFRLVLAANYKGKHVVVEGDLIALAKGRIEVFLTGTAPKGALDPAALKPLAATLAARLRAAHA